MATPINLTVGPLAAASANFFVTSVTPVSGTALTLANTTVAQPRRVLLTTGSEAAPRTLRVTGTNADGNLIRETLAVPATTVGTVQSTQDFKTITEAMPLGGGWTAAITLGTSAVASSPWKLTNVQHQAYESMSWACVVSGTANYSIERTLDNPNNNQNQMGGAFGNYPTPPTPLAVAAGLTAQTITQIVDIVQNMQAWRAVLNSGSGSVAVTMLEAGMVEVR